ncbi:MAG: hypothetical protein JXA04_08215 [Gammaproteobacteria bacterium]|nr:hypothetical protein [Gammaproteobacteria bacterium]
MSERAFNDAKIQIRNMLKEAQYPQARIFATQLLKNYGNDAELLYLRGTACAHRAATQQAEKDLRAAISLQPKCIEYYLTLCNLLFSTGKFELAFGEFARVRNMAPRHPKIKAFAVALNGRNGKLDKALSKCEAEYKATHYKAIVADQLVSLYLIKAIFDWHARYQKRSLLFYATDIKQIENAEYFLDRIRLLPSISNMGRQKRAKLENLIAMSRRKRFDGFIGDRVISVLIVVVGVLVGGFIDLLYAFSAVASFFAFMRPNYIFNRSKIKHNKTVKGRFDTFLDLVYGEQIKSSSKIFNGIENPAFRMFTAHVLKSFLRSILLPLAVFAGFYKNFSVKHAVSFAVGVSLAVAIFAR